MLNPSSALQSLRRVFLTSFTVHDIAEPLVSFDDTTSAAVVREKMDQNVFKVVGIRTDGRVQGYVERDDLKEGACSQHVKRFDDQHIINDSASLVDLVEQLRDQPRLFVSILGQVGGIVSRSDFQKPPVRMWLFGMVTLMEMRTNRMIQRFCPGDDWHQFLSEARLQKAKELMAERSRRTESVSLLDCLQLSDKIQIIAKNKTLLGLTRYESRRQMEEAAKQIEKLRNNLAHSQPIVPDNWDTIVGLSGNVDNIVEGPPGFKEHAAGSETQK